MTVRFVLLKGFEYQLKQTKKETLNVLGNYAADDKMCRCLLEFCCICVYVSVVSSSLIPVSISSYYQFFVDVSWNLHMTNIFRRNSN